MKLLSIMFTCQTMASLVYKAATYKDGLYLLVGFYIICLQYGLRKLRLQADWVFTSFFLNYLSAIYGQLTFLSLLISDVFPDFESPRTNILYREKSFS